MTGAKILLADFKNADVSAQTPYLFKTAGCRVEVFCYQRSWLLKNSYWDYWHQPTAEDVDIYVQELQTLINNNGYDWVVLTDDTVLKIVNDRITDENNFKKILPIDKIQYRGILGSKAKLSIFCAEQNIATPDFAIYDHNSNPINLAAQIGFPLLLKIDTSGGGKGIYFITDNQTLTETINGLPADKKNNLVFQKYIVGDNISVEALYRHGQLIGCATSKVLENVTTEFSVSRVRFYQAHPNLIPLLTTIGRAFGLNGFCSMTFMREKLSKRYYLVEADLRPHAWFYLSKFSGVNFSQLISIYLNQNSTPQKMFPLTNSNEKIIKHFSRDLKWQIEHRSLTGTLSWYLNVQASYKFLPWYDQKLFWLTHIHILKSYLFNLKWLLAIHQSVTKLFKSTKKIG